jgi:predicted enzyme related to lactoylglutathione lyase
MTIPTGKFVWFEYMAPDVKKAQGFFGELFNWTTQDVPMPGGSYTMIASGGETIGGYMTTPQGAPTNGHWLPHLQVTDVAATSAKITAAGGKIRKPAFKLGEVGTMAVVADPLDGTFALWQPTQAQGTGDYKGRAGTWCWNELYTADPEAMIKFYSSIGGFTSEKMAMPDGDYHMLNSDGKGRAGVMKPPMQGIRQHWMPYVQVASTDDVIAKAKRLGSQIMMEGNDVPEVGRLGILIDPQGASLGVLQPAK